MSQQPEYNLWEPEHPKRGKRRDNFIGWVERDEDGWLWYSR